MEIASSINKKIKDKFSELFIQMEKAELSSNQNALAEIVEFWHNIMQLHYILL